MELRSIVIKKMIERRIASHREDEIRAESYGQETSALRHRSVRFALEILLRDIKSFEEGK